LTVKALSAAGYVQMTRVQEATLSVCLEGMLAASLAFSFVIHIQFSVYSSNDLVTWITELDIVDTAMFCDFLRT
jgi:hypothetical protein